MFTLALNAKVRGKQGGKSGKRFVEDKKDFGEERF